MGSKFIIFDKRIGDAEIIARSESEIGYPCIVKPENVENAILTYNARNIHELRQGILKAFRHADNIIVENIEN